MLQESTEPDVALFPFQPDDVNDILIVTGCNEFYPLYFDCLISIEEKSCFGIIMFSVLSPSPIVHSKGLN